MLSSGFVLRPILFRQIFIKHKSTQGRTQLNRKNNKLELSTYDLDKVTLIFTPEIVCVAKEARCGLLKSKLFVL